jgi:all-trans-8'-apo-beta-carotenal 15,15'-oxygenase
VHTSLPDMPVSKLSRRSLLARLSALTAAGLVEPQFAAAALSGKRDLGRLAVQAPSAEGHWPALAVEGEIPRDLNGTLCRVAPGQKINHGVPLRHFFDGDAFLIQYRLRDGKASVSARFIATPERTQEIAAGKMLYNEFGTAAPGFGKDGRGPGGKNQPSINVIRWDGRLLGLSEGGHPSAVDPDTLVFQGHWDFHGTLPKDVSFTAHPKFDPVTGIGYAFGTHQGRDLALTVYRMELDGRLTQLAAIPQPSYFMVHDMLMGSEHLVLVVPPVHYDLPTMLAGRIPSAEALRYAATEPTRLIILRKDGTGTPVIIEQPACMVFHHGNLTETGDTMTIDSILTPDDSILRYIAAWSGNPPPPKPTELTRLTIDLGQRQVTGRSVFAEGQEFPRFDTRMSGKASRYLYTLEMGERFSLQSLIRHDLSANTSHRVEAGKGHAFEEAVFVPRQGASQEDEGWILHQGYSAVRNETFLDIRDAATLERAARVWTGQHFPVGFHGNFYSDA